jgi:hypothetical protein
MCRAALGESNIAQAQAVNDGIVHLMAVPTCWLPELVMYRMRKKKRWAKQLF